MNGWLVDNLISLLSGFSFFLFFLVVAWNRECVRVLKENEIASEVIDIFVRNYRFVGVVAWLKVITGKKRVDAIIWGLFFWMIKPSLTIDERWMIDDQFSILSDRWWSTFNDWWSKNGDRCSTINDRWWADNSMNTSWRSMFWWSFNDPRKHHRVLCIISNLLTILDIHTKRKKLIDS